MSSTRLEMGGEKGNQASAARPAGKALGLPLKAGACQVKTTEAVAAVRVVVGGEVQKQTMIQCIQRGTQTMLVKVYNYRMLRLFFGAMALLIAMAALGCSSTIDSEPAGQKSFASPQQAVAALVAAVQDDNEVELLAILGPGSEDLTSSGDKIADRNSKARFLKAYAAKNSLAQENAARAILIIGDEDYPFSIPIVQQDNAWRFDTQAGRDEILNRRIGRNELHTIEVMQAYTDAQREYACLEGKGGSTEFAQKFSSSEGTKDGLYWEAGQDEEESPFGPLIVRAAEEGYDEGGLDKVPPEPFYGYYFKILKRQGEHANGGAYDYVVDGNMVLGFALVAYPAKYGISGIMTFIINQEGVIYEKDLGEDTATAAAAMTTFDPDDTWRKDEKPAEQ